MVKIHSHWLLKCWQQDLARKVCSMKQNKTPFSNFINSLHCDNLLLKGSQFYLSPVQLCTQIESNITAELTAAYNHWKDSHESSRDEAEPPNNAVPQANAAVTAAAAMLKAEERLQGFINTLTKLDQKLIKDQNTHKCNAEEAARSLKQSSFAVGLMDSARRAPFTRAQSGSSSHTQTTAFIS